MRICENGPLNKFMRFLFMRSSTLCIVTYSALEIYMGQIYAIDLCLTHIIHINKSHAKICCFIVIF